MNTLQKQKYAAALGMSVNQMSDLVLRNAELSDIEQQARDAGDEQTLNMLKQRDLQQQIADFTEKLRLYSLHFTFMYSDTFPKKGILSLTSFGIPPYNSLKVIPLLSL